MRCCCSLLRCRCSSWARSSAHREGKPRGERSAHLPRDAFVTFLQNHDQVGNRALGERLSLLAPPEALRMAYAVLLLAPSVPLLFMGEEFGARTPFLYFCDFQGDLARAVRDGRRREFAAFARFTDEKAQAAIPDPNAESTFLASKLRWEDLGRPEHAGWLSHTRELLALRRREVVPRIAAGSQGTFETIGAGGLVVDWALGDGSRLHLRANFGADPVPFEPAPGELLHSEGGPPRSTTWGPAPRAQTLGAWSGAWTLERA